MTIDDISAALGTSTAALQAALSYAALSGTLARANADLQTLIAAKAAAVADYDAKIVAQNAVVAAATTALETGIATPAQSGSGS